MRRISLDRCFRFTFLSLLSLMTTWALCFPLPAVEVTLPGTKPHIIPTTIPSGGPKPGPNPSAESIEFDRFEENTIFFKAHPPLKTTLYDLTYLGVLTPDQGEPYFLFSGRTCQECLDDRNLFALRPSHPKPTLFVYPGKIFEPKTRALVLESRAFFGQCIPRTGDALVVFQREKVDRRSRMQSSVLVAEASKNFLSERLIERHLPSITTTLKQVKKKLCHEVQGRNRLMLNKSLDLEP